MYWKEFNVCRQLRLAPVKSFTWPRVKIKYYKVMSFLAYRKGVMTTSSCSVGGYNSSPSPTVATQLQWKRNRRTGLHCFGLWALISCTQVKHIHRSEWMILPESIIPTGKYTNFILNGKCTSPECGWWGLTSRNWAVLLYGYVFNWSRIASVGDGELLWSSTQQEDVALTPLR